MKVDLQFGPVFAHLDALFWGLGQTVQFSILSIVFGTLIPFYAYLTAVKMVGAETSSLLACAEPLAAAVIGMIWLGTHFGLYD